MKKNETNLYQIDVDLLQTHRVYVRVPKDYKNTYELSTLIKSYIEDESIEIDELYDESEIDDIRVSPIENDCVPSYLDTRKLLLPSCNPKDLNLKNVFNVTLDITETDD